MFKAKDIMTRDVISVSPETEITQAAKILLDKGINGVPVVEGKKLIGILCQSDLIAQQKNIPMPSLFTLLDGLIPLGSIKNFEKAVRKIVATTVADAMTPHPVTTQPETDIQEIASLMLDKNIHTIPVTDKGELVGIIGKEDILKTIVSGKPGEKTGNL